MLFIDDYNNMLPNYKSEQGFLILKIIECNFQRFPGSRGAGVKLPRSSLRADSNMHCRNHYDLKKSLVV